MTIIMSNNLNVIMQIKGPGGLPPSKGLAGLNDGTAADSIDSEETGKLF